MAHRHSNIGMVDSILIKQTLFFKSRLCCHDTGGSFFQDFFLLVEDFLLAVFALAGAFLTAGFFFSSTGASSLAAWSATGSAAGAAVSI